MRLRFDGRVKQLCVTGSKTRHPLFKAVPNGVEQRVREAGRHVCKRRGKCHIRPRLDVREDARDLFA